MKKTAPYIVIVILLLVLFKTCNTPEPKPEIITKIKTVHDTIIKTKISAPKTVTITKRYIDTIIKKERTTDTLYKEKLINTNLYKTKLESNNAVANLEIYADSLHDVKGVITYPETTITKAQSGLFLYGKSNIDVNQFETGLMYQFKNTVILGAGVGYDTQIQKPNVSLTIGIRL